VEKKPEQQILDLVESLLGGDLKGFADDADYVTVAGEWLRGRRELAGRFRSSTLRADRISIRFLRPEVAVVHFQWETAGEPVRQGITTILASEDRGRWRFDAAQNTDIVAD